MTEQRHLKSESTLSCFFFLDVPKQIGFVILSWEQAGLLSRSLATFSHPTSLSGVGALWNKTSLFDSLSCYSLPSPFPSVCLPSCVSVYLSLSVSLFLKLTFNNYHHHHCYTRRADIWFLFPPSGYCSWKDTILTFLTCLWWYSTSHFSVITHTATWEFYRFWRYVLNFYME